MAEKNSQRNLLDRHPRPSQAEEVEVAGAPAAAAVAPAKAMAPHECTRTTIYPIHKQILESEALKRTHTKHGSYLLPVAFPEERRAAALGGVERRGRLRGPDQRPLLHAGLDLNRFLATCAYRSSINGRIPFTAQP